MNVPHPLPALYWMWRQRSLDIRDWSRLREDLPLDGARVAVVGNAGYLASEDQGALIDGHDLVIRMNNFRVRGFERAVGARTDVFLSNFYVPDIDFSNPAFAGVQWIVSSRPNVFRKPNVNNLDLRYGEHLTEGLCLLGRRTAYVPSLSYITAIAGELMEPPTTGLMGLALAMDVLLPRCDSVYVTGFSFFDGKRHYFSDDGGTGARHHNLQSEKSLLAHRLHPFAQSGQVRLDPTVERHLHSQ